MTLGNQRRNEEPLELHRAAREEVYHHSSVNMQMYAAWIVILSIFVLAIGTLFGSNGAVRDECSRWVKGGIILAHVAINLYFYQAFARIDSVFRAAEIVRERIEQRLLSDAQPSRFEGLKTVLLEART